MSVGCFSFHTSVNIRRLHRSDHQPAQRKTAPSIRMKSAELVRLLPVTVSTIIQNAHENVNIRFTRSPDECENKFDKRSRKLIAASFVELYRFSAAFSLSILTFFLLTYVIN